MLSGRSFLRVPRAVRLSLASHVRLCHDTPRRMLFFRYTLFSPSSHDSCTIMGSRVTCGLTYMFPGFTTLVNGVTTTEAKLSEFALHLAIKTMFRNTRLPIAGKSLRVVSFEHVDRSDVCVLCKISWFRSILVVTPAKTKPTVETLIPGCEVHIPKRSHTRLHCPGALHIDICIVFPVL